MCACVRACLCVYVCVYACVSVCLSLPLWSAGEMAWAQGSRGECLAVPGWLQGLLPLIWGPTAESMGTAAQRQRELPQPGTCRAGISRHGVQDGALQPPHLPGPHLLPLHGAERPQAPALGTRGPRKAQAAAPLPSLPCRLGLESLGLESRLGRLLQFSAPSTHRGGSGPVLRPRGFQEPQQRPLRPSHCLVRLVLQLVLPAASGFQGT